MVRLRAWNFPAIILMFSLETPEEHVSPMAHGVAGSHTVSKVFVFLTYQNTVCHLSFSFTKPEQSCSSGSVAACREPKSSKLVRQKVLKPQLSVRYKLYSHFFAGLFLFPKIDSFTYYYLFKDKS